MKIDGMMVLASIGVLAAAASVWLAVWVQR